jgi:hypothetical protein
MKMIAFILGIKKIHAHTHTHITKKNKIQNKSTKKTRITI